MRTKFEILQARHAELRAAANAVQNEIYGLDRTPCNLMCDCGEQFTSEGDFAQHFIIPDERFLNLGECPIKDANKKMRPSTGTVPAERYVRRYLSWPPR